MTDKKKKTLHKKKPGESVPENVVSEPEIAWMATPKKRRFGKDSSKALREKKTTTAAFPGRGEKHLIDIIREGVPYSQFEKLDGLAPFTTREWASYLHISARTLDRLKTSGKRFNPEQSERILKIEQLINHGNDVFGDAHNFFTWLGTKSIAMGGIIPKDILDTTVGIKMVDNELGRIEHGIPA